MEEESRQRQSRMDKGEPYMSIQPAEDPDGKFSIRMFENHLERALIKLSEMFHSGLKKGI